MAAVLGNKETSFPFSPYHSSYNKRRLSSSVDSANAVRNMNYGGFVRQKRRKKMPPFA
jgi:hypothetical protein